MTLGVFGQTDYTQTYSGDCAIANGGSLNWVSGGVLMEWGTIHTDAGATFNAATNDTIVVPGGTNTIGNPATFEKSGVRGTTDIAAVFNDTGTVQVRTGTREFDGGGTALGGCLGGQRWRHPSARW